jgi:hypothetical protein
MDGRNLTICVEEFFTACPFEPDQSANLRIRQLKGEPSSNGKKVRVFLEVDPFNKRPSVEIRLFDPDGMQGAGVDILETINSRVELNMHLRGDRRPGEYLLEAILFYVDMPDASQLSIETLERQVMDTAQQIVLIET